MKRKLLATGRLGSSQMPLHEGKPNEAHSLRHNEVIIICGYVGSESNLNDRYRSVLDAHGH